MTWEQFVAMLVSRLDLPPEPVTRYTGLFDDLGIDSFQALELIVIIESAAGLVVPPPDLPEMYTLGDAYEYYEIARAFAGA